MKFDLLKEFLQEPSTLKSFAAKKNLTVNQVSNIFGKCTRRIMNTALIDALSIIRNTSTQIIDLRSHCEQWLKAIEEYEKVINAPIDLEEDCRRIKNLTVSELVQILQQVNLTK